MFSVSEGIILWCQNHSPSYYVLIFPFTLPRLLLIQLAFSCILQNYFQQLRENLPGLVAFTNAFIYIIDGASNAEY